MRRKIDNCPECGNDLLLFDGVDYFCPECDYTIDDVFLFNDKLYENDDNE